MPTDASHGQAERGYRDSVCGIPSRLPGALARERAAMKRRRPKGSARMPRISMDVIARDYLGLASEEMRVAMYEQSVGLKESNEYARNKALQSAGYAAELAYKALLLAQGTRPPGDAGKGHRVLILHRKLEPVDKRILEAAIRQIGWPSVDRWLRYMDETVRPALRRYLMYDLTGQRRGVTYPTHGPASIDGIGRVVAKAFELADARVGFTAMQNKQRQSQAAMQAEAGGQAVERGPHIATINIPAGHAADGEFLGGIAFDPETGGIEIMDRDSSTRT